MIWFRVILVCLLLASCNSRIEKAELIGQYVWNDNRVDTLEIRANETYEYWTFKPGQKIASSGIWKFDSLKNEIEFQREYFPFLKEHSLNGSWFSSVYKKNGEIYLPNSREEGKYLKQIRKD